MEQIKIGIIGGTGLYNIDGFKNKKEITVQTPFGMPSDNLTVGELCGKKVVFLRRNAVGNGFFP